ncbi:hypothetical protein SDJN02_10070, partial [Cucurbita argyrosperma subsp. argyrosperma]
MNWGEQRGEISIFPSTSSASFPLNPKSIPDFPPVSWLYFFIRCGSQHLRPLSSTRSLSGEGSSVGLRSCFLWGLFSFFGGSDFAERFMDSLA